MKKIDSNAYAGRIIGFGLLFSIAIPGALYLLNALSNAHWALLSAYISMGIGSLIFLFLIVLLSIEARQDDALSRKHLKNRDQIACIGRNQYECQACGSRDVHTSDTACRTCGIRFRKTNPGA